MRIIFYFCFLLFAVSTFAQNGSIWRDSLFNYYHTNENKTVISIKEEFSNYMNGLITGCSMDSVYFSYKIYNTLTGEMMEGKVDYTSSQLYKTIRRSGQCISSSLYIPEINAVLINCIIGDYFLFEINKNDFTKYFELYPDKFSYSFARYKGTALLNNNYGLNNGIELLNLDTEKRKTILPQYYYYNNDEGIIDTDCMLIDSILLYSENEDIRLYDVKNDNYLKGMNNIIKSGIINFARADEIYEGKIFLTASQMPKGEYGGMLNADCLDVLSLDIDSLRINKIFHIDNSEKRIFLVESSNLDKKGMLHLYVFSKDDSRIFHDYYRIDVKTGKAEHLIKEATTLNKFILEE